jgi:hypothetical protein
MTRETGGGPEGALVHRPRFAEFLRRALHAAADQVEPQEDGLAPIRARILAGSGSRDRQPKGSHRQPGRRRGAYRAGPRTGTQRP